MRMMGSLTCMILLAVIALTSRAVWASSDYHGEEDASQYAGCWDCNYAPSGFVKGYGDWQHGTAEVGYMRCALVTRYDPFFIHKNHCKSGRCYIRKEENGMVYRGCADYENLPWDVTTDVNCKYQGPGKALWWFCDGDKCNRGQLGETEDTCGSPPVPPTYAPEPTELPTPVYDTPAADQGSYHGFRNGHNHYGQQQYGYQQYGAHLVALSLVPWGHPADPIYRQDHQQQEGGYGQEDNQVDHYGGPPPQVVTQPPPAELYNPCDGKCYQNPSGLFEDPQRPDHFIQCGCDNYEGRPCTCCKPFYIKCESNTVFDNTKKVCVRLNKPY